MAMIASHLPVEITSTAHSMSQQHFERWAAALNPPFPTGPIVINGVFDRYFDPETQACWEGFQKAMLVSLNIKLAEIHRRHARFDIPQLNEEKP